MVRCHLNAGAFGTRWSAIASICRRPAPLDLGLAFRWPISRARRQMRGDRIKHLGLRTYRTSCINATDSICRRARMGSQSVVKRGQCARVDDKSNRSRSACGNATCGTFQHFRIAPRGDKCEAIACLRVATPPAGSTPTHDSIRANRKFSRRRGLGFCCIKNAETAAERKVSLVFQTARYLNHSRARVSSATLACSR